MTGKLPGLNPFTNQVYFYTHEISLDNGANYMVLIPL